jgi:metal-responsive CopG/Arc/MetJ family transcriptional regulator
MERLTISLPSELRGRMEQIASKRGMSLAAFVREAIEDASRSAGNDDKRARPRPKSLGAYNSGHRNTAQLASDMQRIVELGLAAVEAEELRLAREVPE